MPVEQIDQLQEKAQKELVMVRQRLDEALSQERRAMRCGLIKKRRELISDMVRISDQTPALEIHYRPQNLYVPPLTLLPAIYSCGSTNRDRKICRVCPKVWREGWM